MSSKRRAVATWYASASSIFSFRVAAIRSRSRETSEPSRSPNSHESGYDEIYGRPQNQSQLRDCRMFRQLGSVAVCLIAVSSVLAERPVRYNEDIRPILSNRCFRCHGPDKKARANDLRLDIERITKSKLDSGERAIVAGNPKQSHLLVRLSSDDPDVRMPPKKSGPPLSAREIKLLTRWIKEGAKWERHWSLVSPQRPRLPRVKNPTWSKHPVDRFVAAQIESHPRALRPSPLADRVTLVRRLHFDLIGLPPTPRVVNAYVRSQDPSQLDRLVDQLLASPHFGERMAIYWLDLVRYADSVGYHGDQERSISPYRSYVVRAFNRNLPFDQFTTEQLAGDLLPKPTLWQRVAAGYNMLGMTTIEGGAQPKEYLAKYAADRVRTTSSVWMAATLGCAECHDHKFDPYSTTDFYRFSAFFADIQQRGVANPKENLAVPNPAEAERLAAMQSAILKLAQLKRPSSANKKKLAALRRSRKRLVNSFAQTIVPVSGKPRTTRVFPRGDWLDESGKVVQPGVPESLGGLPWIRSRRATRLDLARWLTSKEHPHTSRVFVNRLWKHFFGVGLSNVLDDIGSQGEWPTHPALLDWLAVEFVESGWDVKHMVRLLVTSRAYRQSSVPSAEQLKIDPGNRQFARQSRFRLEAELIRDNALAVSGLLLHRLDSRRSRPYQPVGYYAHLNFPKRKYTASRDGDQYRRGVYVHWQRTFLHPSLLAFDGPSREECTALRPRSNTPQAALTLLNDPSMVEAARALAAKVLKRKQRADKDRIDWLWQVVLSRRANGDEQALLAELLRDSRQYFRVNQKRGTKLLKIGISGHPNHLDTIELASWTSVCRAVLNLSEAITRN